jgi:type IV pilus assembly protein PilY1
LGLLNVSLLFTEYIPTGDACDPLGETLLNAVHFETGTAAPFAALGAGGTTNNNGSLISARSVEYGLGLVRDVVVDPTRDRVIGQDATGGLRAEDIEGPDSLSGRMSWRELQIDW